MNPEHVEIVEQGKAAIDEWRQANPGQRLDLSGANLSEANLIGANLSGANLSEANLSGAELTGAYLYGTARDDWKIDGIKCRYVFWDLAGKERSPRDRDLAPGEFEILYAQLPTIEYVFENGMTPLDPLVMDRVVQAVNQQNPEFKLQIDSINARGIYPSIKLTVAQEEQKGAALEAVTQEYRETNAKLQGANEALSGVIDRLIQHGIGGPVTIGSGSNVALGSGASLTINTDEYIHHLEEIEQAIKDAPPESFIQTTKQEALDTVSGAVKDVAKGKMKEAAEAVTRLGIKLGPGLATKAFQFFQNLPG